MKKLFFKIVILLLVCLFVYIGFKSFVLAKVGYFQITTPIEIKLEIKDFFSSEQKKIVENYFDEFIKNHSVSNFDPKVFYSELLAKVIILKEVIFNVDSSKVGNLIVFGVLPKFEVNNDFVIAENYKVYPKKLFEHFDFTLLHVLNISSKFSSREISPKLYNFLQTVPLEIWNHYTLFYESPTLIKLREITSNDCMPSKMEIKSEGLEGIKCLAGKYEIIVDEHSIFEKEKFENIQKIYSDIEAKKNGKSSLKKKLVFDMRFNRRILVKAESF